MKNIKVICSHKCKLHRRSLFYAADICEDLWNVWEKEGNCERRSSGHARLCARGKGAREWMGRLHAGAVCALAPICVKFRMQCCEHVMCVFSTKHKHVGNVGCMHQSDVYDGRAGKASKSCATREHINCVLLFNFHFSCSLFLLSPHKARYRPPLLPFPRPLLTIITVSMLLLCPLTMPATTKWP